MLVAEQSKKQTAELTKKKMEAAGVPILDAILSGYNVKTSTKNECYYMYESQKKTGIK